MKLTVQKGRGRCIPIATRQEGLVRSGRSGFSDADPASEIRIASNAKNATCSLLDLQNLVHAHCEEPIASEDLVMAEPSRSATNAPSSPGGSPEQDGLEGETLGPQSSEGTSQLTDAQWAAIKQITDKIYRYRTQE